MTYNIRIVNDITELNKVLKFCYQILGECNDDVYDVYGPEAWANRLNENYLMVFAEAGGDIVSAVMGRAENQDSIVLGYVACSLDYRKNGITSSLLSTLEDNARKYGYKYITLGSADDAFGFYEKCGYHMITEIHGQKIYQKLL